ncbi:MAG: c-type cytochrome [Candidatus Cyclobacteriaceae bacterium M2_1C_046]
MQANYLFLAVIFLFSCSGKQQEDRQENLKMQQYMIAGKGLYIQHCSACHQPEGEGLAKLYPPLNKSDFMENNLNEVACMIRYGRTEPVVVNGITYTQPMPGNPTLTNLEIAEILTYIYNSWEHGKGMINVKEVDRMMSECEKRKKN